MTALGELSLWAAAPFLGLAAFAWLAGGWSGRRRLADLGGRAAEAAAALLFVSLIGLVYALVTVRLRYAYVAGYSGFQLSWPWRIAGLWSGPGGAALLLGFLLAVAAATAYRVTPTRGSAGRSGALAVLALFALLVVARAAPFARPDSPAAAGAGLAIALRDLSWQVEAFSLLLATVCAAFAFAGLLGGQLVESPGRDRWERGAVVLAAGLLSIAVLAAIWRAYTDSGHLLRAAGVALVAVHVPGWLLAFAHLHAPAGLAAPTWALRWRRITGVALFPTLLGAGAALLAARGSIPPAVPWVGALAVGVVSGAMAGMAAGSRWVGDLELVPGFGLYAASGGLVALAAASLAAAWGLLRLEMLGGAVWLVVLIGLAAAVAASAGRPTGRRGWIWPAALGGSAFGAILILLISGVTLMALSGGLALGLLVGAGAELGRIRRARVMSSAQVRRLASFRWRAERRWASALAHLGVGLLAVGLSAEPLTRSESEGLQPGGQLEVRGALGGHVRLTYLGLSNYQVGNLDREVASFRLQRGGGGAELLTASSTYDWSTRRQVERPAVEAGVLGDVIVRMAGRGGGDSIVCQLSVRPLASLVWLGGLLLLASTLARGRPAP